MLININKEVEIIIFYLLANTNIINPNIGNSRIYSLDANKGDFYEKYNGDISVYKCTSF